MFTNMHICPEVKAQEAHAHSESAFRDSESAECVLSDADCWRNLCSSDNLHNLLGLCETDRGSDADVIVRVARPTPEAFYLSGKLPGCISHSAGGHVFRCVSPVPIV